jgi:hypothetical protein
MTGGERQFDDTVAAWVDEGAESAPERFVWAALDDVARTPQRGPWLVALEDMTMNFKAAAPILGIAAVLLALVVGYQVIGQRNTGEPIPAATPRLLSAEDLERIVVTEANVPPGLTVHRTLTGMEALGASETAPEDSPGFVDAILTDFDRDDDTENGRYGTFAAVFETVADAERAYDSAVRNHESPDGWGLTTDHVLPFGYDPDPGLGDESRWYVQGRAYNQPKLEIYLWRVNNVLLHAVDLEGYDDPDLILSIAQGMDARAH